MGGWVSCGESSLIPRHSHVGTCEGVGMRLWSTSPGCQWNKDW